MEIEVVDLVVIGAGPAGLAAAIEARGRGLQVVLLDEQPAAGGQIYRTVDASTAKRRAALGEDYRAGAALTKAFAECGASHVAEAAVWNVGRDLRVNYLRKGVNRALQAKRIILASGAMERPFPIPGWTLPGVMGAGAAQILFKTAGALPREPIVLAGCGPLLYLLASQYLDAGVAIKALVHTTRTSDYLRASKSFMGALRGWTDLKKGVRMLAHLRRSGVPVFAGATDFAVHGGKHAEGLSFVAGGKEHRVESRLILLHQGVVPNTQLSWALRANHRWNPAQLCWEPETDGYGQIEGTGIYVAGDSRGIVGAKASATQGRLASLDCVRALGRAKAADLAAREDELRSTLGAQLAIRPFLDALYRPLDDHRVPRDPSVVICRCEEVTSGQVRSYVDIGCQGPNQTKAFGRCGMGPCQGRLCGLTVTELIADARGVSPADVGYYRIRPPIKPVTIGELAA